MNTSEILDILGNCELFKGLNTVEIENVTKLGRV